MKSIIINLALLSSLSLAESAFNLEQEKAKLSNKVFNHYDLNHNATLSFEEFATFSKEMQEKEQNKQVAKTIKSCDKDGNNKIELSEVPTLKERREMFKEPRKMVKMCRMDRGRFEFIDKDKDEHLTSEEILLSYKNRFQRMGMPPREMPKRDELKEFKERLKACDKNEDGALNLIETTSNLCYMTSDIFLQYSSTSEASFKIAEVTHPPKIDKAMGIEHKLKECDGNGDKQLTLVEATSMWCHISSDTFSELDTNGDKLLVKSELTGMFDQRIEPQKFSFKIMKNMPPAAQIHVALGQCDGDKNGKLSREEAKKCELSMEVFEKFDYDKSDTIEANDLEIQRKKREFEMVDMNSDNKIDIKEFTERMGNRCRIF